MKDLKELVAMLLGAVAHLAKLNAVLGAVLGFIYSQIASLFDREFIGLDGAQIMLVGIGVCIISFGLSLAFSYAASILVAEEAHRQPTN